MAARITVLVRAPDRARPAYEVTQAARAGRVRRRSADSWLSGQASARKPLTVCPSGCAYSEIQAAINAAPNGDTIAIAPGTYGPVNTDDKSVTLRGAGASETAITAGGVNGVSVVYIGSGVVTITGVTITAEDMTAGAGHSGITNHGTATLRDSTITSNSGSGVPGGIANSGTMTLTHSAITNNSGGPSTGGIDNRGTMTLNHSTVTKNSGYGGGILNVGTMTLKHSTVDGNSGYRQFGGIVNYGTMTLKHSTISNNSGTNSSGGIDNIGTMALSDSAVTRNRAANPGTTGGIANGGELTLKHSTVTYNQGGLLFSTGGISAGGTVTLLHSTVSCNIPTDIAGSYTQKHSTIGGCI